MAAPGSVLVLAERAATRCALCHDGLAGGAAVCAGCRTWFHVDCGTSLRTCPTLGCRRSRVRPPRVARGTTHRIWMPARPRSRRRPWALYAGLVFTTLLGVGVVTVNLMARGETCRVDPVSAEACAIRNAFNLYRVDTGVSPSSLDDLMERPAGAVGWRGPYLQAEPIDPWGHPYRLEVGQDLRRSFVSLGADGAPGGTEEDADLSIDLGPARRTPPP